MRDLLVPIMPECDLQFCRWTDHIILTVEDEIHFDSFNIHLVERAATDYVALLQHEGIKRANSPRFVIFEDATLTSFLRENVDALDAVSFEDAVAKTLSAFKTAAHKLMIEIIPSMAATTGVQDFTVISNVYLQASGRMPVGAGVYYGNDTYGYPERFPTVIRPTLFNRFNLGFRMKHLPDEAFISDSLDQITKITRELLDDDMIAYTEEEAEALYPALEAASP